MDADPKTVMIVEDEPEAAELFAEMMRVSGFQVIKASSSTLAMSLIAERNPDVIILDIMMPDVSGIEILHYMQRESTLAKIPVVVVSAKSMPSDVAEGLKAGAAAYLTKPVGFAELKNAVERALGGIRKSA
ncbi:MAG TPA: response regulator [Anaerolineales bacterium]|nr:response regulator [Anaerolineales bacterium]